MTDLDSATLLSYQPSPDLLKDRVLLVTGAAKGIGRAISLAAAELGATIILLDKDIRGMEKTYDEIEAAGHAQPAIYPLNFEGATVKDYSDLAENIATTLDRLDGLVLNAGWSGILTPIKRMDPEIWARVLHCNLNGPILLVQAVLSLLEASPDPSIIWSTHHSRKAFWGAFGVAKAGQEALIDILSLEHSADPGFIRVNGIDTGPVNTELRRRHYPGENALSWPEPEAVVAPYLFFLGPDAGHISGQNIRLTFPRTTGQES